MELTIAVKVTQNHLDDGQPGSCETCPVALAIRDAIDDRWPKSIYKVFLGTIGLQIDWNCNTSSSQRYSHSLPPEITTLIKDIDSGEIKVEPYDFELAIKVPQEVIDA